MSTKTKTKRLLATLLTAAMSVALFAGCGGSSNQSSASSAAESSAASSESSAAPTDAASSEAEPASDGEKILRFSCPPGIENKFMPIMNSNTYDGYINDMVFEPLITVDAEGTYIAGPITEKFELSEDHLTYTFTLKDGVTFSDGTPLTSADVLFTYMVCADPAYDGPRLYYVNLLKGYDAYKDGTADTIEGIQVIDDKTISFTYNDPSPANVSNLVAGIMSKDYYAYETYEQFLTKLSQPMGSGPLVLESYEPKQYWSLEKNQNYWDPANHIKIDGVMISEIPNESQLAAFTTGQIDFFQETNINKKNYDTIDATEGLNAYTFLGNGYTFMCFNTTRPTLEDVRVRQALLYALDRKSFIEAEYGSSELARVGMAPFSPAQWAFPDEKDLNAYDFDMAKAESLMAEAGWVKNADGILEKDGVTMDLTWLVYTEASWPGTLSGMAADSWKQLGVNLNIELQDFNTVGARTQDAAPADKDFDIYTMGFSVTPEPDPAGALFDADAYAEGGFNASGYRNERAQELIKLGREEFDQTKRQEYYNEFAILMNQEIPTTIVAYRNELWGVSERVHGLDMGTFQTWANVIRNVTID